MANDSQREKARAIFGKTFFENSKAQPLGKQTNSMQALQQRANARPIPTYKVGGVVKKNPEVLAERGAKRAVKAERDFSGLLGEAADRAARKGMPVMKQGGPTDEYTAKRVRARMEAGNYKDGGEVDRYKGKLDRKKADIEKDYKKALSKGKNADVAKAKYEQRMADAADDYAKWTKGDRTATKAAEKAAEKNLTMTRKFGARSSEGLVAKAESKLSDKPASLSSTGDTPKQSIKADLGNSSFASAFRAARNAGDKTFTWKGKSFTTAMAGEGSKRSGASNAAAPVRRVAASKATGAAPKAGGSAPKAADQKTKQQQSMKSSGSNLARDAAVTVTAGPSAVAGVRAADAAAKAAINSTKGNAPKMDARLTAAERLERQAAEKRKAEQAPTGYNIGAKALNMIGFGSGADARSAANYRAQVAREQREQSAVATKAQRDRAAAAAAAQAKAKANADRVAKLRAAGREMDAKFYERNPNALKTGGKVGKYAAGGAGKVRKGQMKGK